jgi:DNA-binding IclR family transcriptional regulator
MAEISFLTNHGHVMACVARDGDMRLREIADCVGITERAAQRIVRELEEQGYLTRQRVGRTNVYDVHPEVPMRTEVERDVPVGRLVSAILAGTSRSARRAA